MKNIIEEHYRNLYLKYGEDPASAQYSSKESQYLRFKYLAEIANIKKQTILDFGCGTGAFYDFLIKNKKIPKKYIGIDIVDEFLVHCKKKIPDGLFGKPNEIDNFEYDFGFASGIFNNIRENNKEFWRDTVRQMFKRCNKGIAFNMMSLYVDYYDKDLYYESPEEVFKFVKNEITPFVNLRHNYIVKNNSIPFEFIIYAYRNPSGIQVNL